MKIPVLMLAVVGAILTFNVSAVPAATPRQTITKLRAQLAAAKKANTKLTRQRDDFKGRWTRVKSDLTASQTKLTTMTADRDAQIASSATATATAASALATANGTIGALQGQIALQAQGGAAAVIAGGPNAMWAGIISIWAAFPSQPPSGYCGFDKSNSVTGGTGLNFAHYDFENVTNC